MSADRQLSILVLCDTSRSHAGTVREHLSALRKRSRHRVYLFNSVGTKDSRFLNLDAFDAVILHYSLVITADSYLSPPMRERLRSFKGLKVQFLQDEYRWVDEITAMMRWLEVDVLFSIVPTREIDRVYGERLPDVEIIPTLAGYVPEGLVHHTSPRIGRRGIDLGYRGRVLPYWNGALSQEKVRIAQETLARIPGTGLRCDIAWGENDRLYGQRWIRFLSSSRATLGTESGTSITDFDGSIERATISYLADHPGASFDEVSEAILVPHEGNVMMNVVSPRVFEAAALRTAMVMFPGEYGEVVMPWTHYVPLAKDFSNFDEIVETVKDTTALEEMTARAHSDLIESGRFSLAAFVREFDEVVARRCQARGTGRTGALVAAKVEQSVAARAVNGWELRAPARRAARLMATTRLVATDHQLRSLAREYVGNRELRRRIRVARLYEDLLKLGLMRVRLRNDAALERFEVIPRFDDVQSTLVFSSLPAGETASALGRNGPSIPWDRTRVILWDHRAIGLVVHTRAGWGRWLGVAVGYYGVIGIHHFGAMSEMLAYRPDVVVTAFETVAPPRPRRLPRIPRGDLATAPRNYVVKGYLVAKLLVVRPQLRDVYRAYLSDPRLRSEVAHRAMLEDLLKLYVLDEARSGRVGSVSGVDAIRDRGSFRFVTRREATDDAGAWPEVAGPPPLNEIAWDNRAVGPTLHYPTRLHPQLQIGAGEGGVHYFDGLIALLSRRPEVVANALAKAAAD
jgi:hypothetical protein